VTRPPDQPAIGASPDFEAHKLGDPNQKRRSQPYWVPVTTFEGDGASTTATFDVEPGVLQWRVAWHCTGGRISVAPLRQGQGGGPPSRNLADGATCATDGTGYATQAGRYSLKVDTQDHWKLTVDKQVDTPLVEPLSAEMAAGKVISTGKVYNVDRVGEGTAKVYQLADGSRVMRLEDFFVSINSDLEIRVSPLAHPSTTDEIAAAPYQVVAPLKATLGSMNYPVPPDLDLGQYHSIVIWCEITKNAYAAATLEQS
jgi:hypothetical protein